MVNTISKIGILAVACMLVLGAGCVVVEAPSSSSPTLFSGREAAEPINDQLTVPTSEWKGYSNSLYGFSFRYPKTWQFTQEKGPDYLTVRVGNLPCVNQCPPEFVGFDIRLGVVNWGRKDIVATAKKTVADNTSNGIFPKGETATVKIGGQNALKVADAGWLGPNSGPAYFVTQDGRYYVYIQQGQNNFTAKANKMAKEILNSMHVTKNKLPNPPAKAIAGVQVVPSVPNEGAKEQKTYISRRYGLAVNYPGDCTMTNLSDRVGDPYLLMNLSFCSSANDTIGVYVYNTHFYDTRKYIFGSKLGDNSMLEQTVLVGDLQGKEYRFKNNDRERWILVEFFDRTYAWYNFKDNEGSWRDRFDEVLNSIEFGVYE